MLHLVAAPTLTPELMEKLPPRAPLPDYATDDLSTRDLSKSQSRDFALRNLPAPDIQN
ncbi:hypothetical protein GCM10027404_32600 [Arthrobacter tumbae]